MTRRAFHVRMPTPQRELGVAVVDKLDRLPGGIRVACRTALSHVPLVDVVLAVAGRTAAFGSLEPLLAVAVGTSCLGMLMRERKSCLGVIEVGFLPAVFRVAFIAFAA